MCSVLVLDVGVLVRPVVARALSNADLSTCLILSRGVCDASTSLARWLVQRTSRLMWLPPVGRETILFQTFSSRQWVRGLKLFCSRQHFSSHSVTDNIVPDKTKCQGLFQTKYIACFFTETMSQIIFFQTSNLLT